MEEGVVDYGSKHAAEDRPIMTDKALVEEVVRIIQERKIAHRTRLSEEYASNLACDVIPVIQRHLLEEMISSVYGGGFYPEEQEAVVRSFAKFKGIELTPEPADL